LHHRRPRPPLDDHPLAGPLATDLVIRTLAVAALNDAVTEDDPDGGLRLAFSLALEVRHKRLLERQRRTPALTVIVNPILTPLSNRRHLLHSGLVLALSST